MRMTIGKRTNEGLDLPQKSKHCLRRPSTVFFLFYSFCKCGGNPVHLSCKECLQHFVQMHITLKIIFHKLLVLSDAINQSYVSSHCFVALSLQFLYVVNPLQIEFFDHCSQYGVSCLVGNCVWAGKYTEKEPFCH